MRPLRTTYLLLLLALLLGACAEVRAQGGRGFWLQEWSVEHGDSIATVHILPVYVFARPTDLRRYRRLVAAGTKVYPLDNVRRGQRAGERGGGRPPLIDEGLYVQG